MPTCYHLHVAGGGMIQKWEVAYQHGTEPTHPLPESASPGCRLPTLRHPRPGRKDEPTSARRGFRSSNGNTFHPLPVPSTNDRATFAPGERQRQPQRFRQVRAVHPAVGPVCGSPMKCCPSSKSCCHHKGNRKIGFALPEFSLGFRCLSLPSAALTTVQVAGGQTHRF